MLQKFLNMSFCFSFKSCKEVEKCHVHFILVNCFFHNLANIKQSVHLQILFWTLSFYHKVIQSVQHSKTKSLCMSEAFFFFFSFPPCNVIFIKVCTELGTGYSPLVALCFVVCGLRNAFIRKSVTKISLWTPSSSVLWYQYIPRNIGTARIFLL